MYGTMEIGHAVVRDASKRHTITAGGSDFRRAVVNLLKVNQCCRVVDPGVAPQG
jgi:hypothetical protein